MTEEFDEFGRANKLVWACSCGKGGTALRRGTEGAGMELERQVGGHLRERGSEGHGVDVGRYFTSARLDRTPRPLLWSEDGR